MPTACSEYRIVRKVGNNAGAVQPAAKGARRVLLGQYAFGLANMYEAMRAKAIDPKAPIDIAYFKDYNQTNSAFLCSPKGCSAPRSG